MFLVLTCFITPSNYSYIMTLSNLTQLLAILGALYIYIYILCINQLYCLSWGPTFPLISQGIPGPSAVARRLREPPQQRAAGAPGEAAHGAHVAAWTGEAVDTAPGTSRRRFEAVSKWQNFWFIAIQMLFNMISWCIILIYIYIFIYYYLYR